MTALFRLREATVAEIAGELPDPPTHTAIRTHLRILEEKGHVQRHREGRRNVYRPARSRTRASRAALSDVLETFFGGSLRDAVAAHLADPSSTVDGDDLDRLRKLIDEARKRKR